MIIETKYNIEDTILLKDKTHTIKSMHIYESENKHTERYYIGNHMWITIVRSEK